MRDEHDGTTEANRQISPAERAESATRLPNGDDEVTRANVRLARDLDEDRDDPITPDPLLQRSPD